MTLPSLPKLGTPPAPAPLRKIALEEHFGHPIVFTRDSDGRFETRKEAAVGHSGQSILRSCRSAFMGGLRQWAFQAVIGEIRS